LDKDANDKIVFIGCYACDYTRKAYPMILKLVEKYHSSLFFLHYPVKEKTDYMSRLGYCIYQENQEKYWQFNNLIFATEKANLENQAYINKTLADLELNQEKITTCTESQQTKDIIRDQLNEIAKTNFYGTPTIFIGNDVLVGPKPYRVYAIRLKGFFYWLR
jgi:protein-disulfide isomerase